MFYRLSESVAVLGSYSELYLVLFGHPAYNSVYCLNRLVK